MVGPHRLPCEIPEAKGTKWRATSHNRWVLPATILGSSLGFIDGSVVNVALPAIQAGLQSSLATMQWVMNGYMLMLASLILLGGTAGDRFGRRRAFIVGLAGFVAASAGCGVAPSAGWLIAARLVQGIAAALLVPASLAIISAAYHGEARGRAIGTWAAAGALTTALGPPLGGWLVDTIGWRSIFFINLPIGVAALLLAWKLPADGNADDVEPLDLRGAVLATLALGLLSYGLIAFGEGNGVAGAIAIAAAIPASGLFIVAERRSAAPMLPLSLFRNRDFAGANSLTVLLYAALSGALFLLPFVLIQAHGYSATAAGAAFLPFSVIMGAGSRWTGSLVKRIGPRLPLMTGPALTAAGFVILGLSGDNSSYWIGFLPGLVAVGIGMTLAVPPLTTTVFDSAPDDKSGTASGINNAAARGGGLVAVAALGLAFGGSDPSAMDAATLIGAYRWVMFAAAALAALSAVTAALTIDAGSKSDQPRPFVKPQH
jgi:EmrB/QacA subfamily drug resistance transporter